jgi:signal peptidase I
MNLHEDNKAAVAKNIIFNILFVVVCIFLAHSLSAHFFVTVPVDGYSMLPNFTHNDRVLLLRTSTVERGDVVVFRDPNPARNAENKHLIKRVIGLPKDEVEIMRSVYGGYYVIVNGEVLTEGFLDGVTAVEPMELTVVPEGKFFYIGDNRANSVDSRHTYYDQTLGENVPLRGCLNEVVGRVILRFGNGSFERISR